MSKNAKKYDAEKCCAKVVECGHRGYTHAQMAAALNISLSTFYEWTRENSPIFRAEFKDAVEVANTAAEAFWTAHLNRATEGAPASTFTKKMGNGEEVERERQYNANLVMFQMRNRFGKQWTEKNHTEISGPDGGPIEVTDARETLSRRLDQLAERARPGGLSDESE